MAQAIIASLPVDSSWVPGCMESIIDKRVNGVALNFLEKLVHCLCSWIYCPYSCLFESKMARVHIFSDGQVRLFDCTKQGIAAIDCGFVNDYITLETRKVFFTPDPNVATVFERKAHIDYVIVKDDAARKTRWYQITVQEMSRPGNQKPMEISWMVNGNVLHQSVNGEAKESYLVEQP